MQVVTFIGKELIAKIVALTSAVEVLVTPDVRTGRKRTLAEVTGAPPPKAARRGRGAPATATVGRGAGRGAKRKGVA